MQNRRVAMVTESSKLKLATGTPSRGIDRIIRSVSEDFPGVEKCFSILVETGVYSPDAETDEQVSETVSGSTRKVITRKAMTR